MTETGQQAENVTETKKKTLRSGAVRSKSLSRPFQYVRVLSWSFFVLILGTSMFLSVIIADNARRILLEKQEDFALLLAENLNHQIFQRFTLPTLLGYGHIELKNEDQYNRLNQVVDNTTHSFHVLEVTIFSTDKSVAYSTSPDLVNKTDLAGRFVDDALEKGKYSFRIISRYPPWKALFKFDLEPESVVLKTVYTLRAERRLTRVSDDLPIIGVLQFTQDITDDYQNVLNFQRLIVLLTITSSLTLFFVVLLILRRADKVAAERIKEKEQYESELHQSEKLASMGRMVASIAHEIRNPLGIIRSSAELLVNKARAKDEKSADSRILQALFDETKRLSNIVNDFLDYARPKNPRRDKVDMAEVVNQVAVFLEQRFKEKDVSFAKTLCFNTKVYGDKDLLYRAVYNLIHNSLDALEEGGSIRVRMFREEGALHLLVEDSGPGFPEEALTHALDPFYTTKDEGTGLGLAIVNTIFKGHGAVLVLGNSDKGARVEVIFAKE